MHEPGPSCRRISGIGAFLAVGAICRLTGQAGAPDDPLRRHWRARAVGPHLGSGGGSFSPRLVSTCTFADTNLPPFADEVAGHPSGMEADSLGVAAADGLSSGARPWVRILAASISRLSDPAG